MRNISIKILVICVFLFGTANLYSQTPITTAQEFANMNPNGNYILANDISVNQMYLLPFTGTLNGNHKKITVNINSNAHSVGLFSTVASAGIQNLIIDGSVTGGANRQNVGSIAGFVVHGMFFFCTNLAEVTGNSSTASVGGIVGTVNNVLHILHCVNNGIISGKHTVAGIVGYVLSLYNADNIIGWCKNSGTIKSIDETSPTYMGGIMGVSVGTLLTIHTSINIGRILSRSSEYAGGIVAYFNESTGGILECLNAGLVDGARTAVGGIVGLIQNVSVGYCLNVNWVEGSATNSGAIVGQNNSSYVHNCYYDNQMCTLATGVGTGLSTANMLATSLQTSLSANWTFSRNALYPHPDNISPMHPIALLAAAPVRLKDTPPVERLDNVRTNFTVSNYNPPIITDPYYYQWSSFSNGTIISIPLAPLNNATINGRGRDTLRVQLDGIPEYEKLIPANVP